MAETLLTVKHLVKQYGDHIVLNDISLDIKRRSDCCGGAEWLRKEYTASMHQCIRADSGRSH